MTKSHYILILWTFKLNFKLVSVHMFLSHGRRCCLFVLQNTFTNVILLLLVFSYAWIENEFKTLFFT